MPEVGSQVILCDLPVRFDTYKGCSHACTYCFVKKKTDISQIELGESVNSLEAFIKGERTDKLKWVDWNIPIHWGGMSDPFQPAEKRFKRSLEALKIFAKYKYPFVVSTKNEMIAQEPYFSLLKECNCVVQFSASCPEMDDVERGASTFQQRIEAARKISESGIRVNIRVQPYLPSLFKSVLKTIDICKEAGVYGMIFESMKYSKKVQGTIKKGGDSVYPTSLLKTHFECFKREIHKRGMRFYSGENRLRQMSDDLCCCGIDGLEGFQPNKANLNHFLYDKQGYLFTEGQKTKDASNTFSCLHQTTMQNKNMKGKTYEELMKMHQRKQYVCFLVPDEVKL